MALNRVLYQNSLLFLLLIVLGTNFSLYHTSFGVNFLADNPNGAVVGSILDLALIAPILYIAWQRHWNWKNILISLAGGLVLVRFIIPMEYLGTYEAVPWIGFGVEGALILFEIYILVSLFKNFPNVIRSVKQSSLPIVFSFPSAVDHHRKAAPIIRIICSEILMFYYAFASWSKKPHISNNKFTIHRNSSLIAFQIMMIHAIILETIGIHWWLHEKVLIVSIVLLIINIYSVIFFVGDIQAVRHNALHVTEVGMYLSLGLMKRMEIKWTDIVKLIDEPELLKRKCSKNTIEFIARDFETVHPNIILQLKHPLRATLLMGKEKEFEQVALRVDDPTRFKETFINNMRRIKND
ncbi:beta-carotene 15,15'-monooxygenase [Bacillus sp. T3]|uniref:beta-carotene 15,15'-monooxygenase n=1 Tax=Bacillus sp. T3 TaxID=467262 RepID=UPI0029818941|nr:beta-carotene 15,15'-monooxygenase [Bacillus sp. T3]